MIRAFIFDIGNVILRFDFAIAMARLQNKMDPVSDAVAHEIERIKLSYEGGAIAREEFLKRIGEVIRFTGTQPEFVSAWEDIFTENIPMTQLIEKLKLRYPLYLLSNTSDIHVDHMFRTYPAFRLFDDAVYSYRVKCMKPGREIYEIAIRQFGVAPEETVFIDDLAPNIATARAAGFHAIQYDHARHDALLKELDGLGVAL